MIGYAEVQSNIRDDSVTFRCGKSEVYTLPLLEAFGIIFNHPEIGQTALVHEVRKLAKGKRWKTKKPTR